MPAPDLSDLGAMDGGAATVSPEPSLPFMLGDTTWGGRPAFPHVIAPAVDLAYPGPGLPIYNDNTNHLVFQMNSGNFRVDLGPLPQSLKSADLVLGLLGFPVGPNSYLPFSAMLLSSPIIGYGYLLIWAENGSIIPQDRVFLDYRHFDAVGSVELINLDAPDATHRKAYYSQQRFGPLSVDRYCLGVKKTFRDGLWSVEVRLSFRDPGGCDPNVRSRRAAGGRLRHRQRRLCAKRDPVRSDRWTITGGLGLQLPTAPHRPHLPGTIRDRVAASHREIQRDAAGSAGERDGMVESVSGGVLRRPCPLFAQGMFQLCAPLNQSGATVTT